jgi:hypothetical protein
MEEISLKEFNSKNKDIIIDECHKCGKPVELTCELYKILIEERLIEIDSLPQLKCIECGEKFLSEKSKSVIIYLYEKLVQQNQVALRTTFKHLNKQYPFCEKYNFKYDYRDYENVPGLTGFTGDGFLTPVFFKKTALVYFMHHPDYELNLGSETYGDIKYKDEFHIDFGINMNGNLVMWLGDLDKLNDETLTFLKIHNIDSDHTFINSEFYRAQMRCIFSEPIKEIQIINLRIKLYILLKQKFGLELNHLDEEVIFVLEDIKKPILFSETEVRPVISSLHKILIEAVNVGNFKTFYRNTANPVERSHNDWLSIKFYEYLLNFLSKGQKTADEIKYLIAPLYLLNDLRIYYFHIINAEKQESVRQNIVACLELTSFDNTPELYNKMIDRLFALFEYLLDKTENALLGCATKRTNISW